MGVCFLILYWYKFRTKVKHCAEKSPYIFTVLQNLKLKVRFDSLMYIAALQDKVMIVGLYF